MLCSIGISDAAHRTRSDTDYNLMEARDGKGKSGRGREWIDGRMGNPILQHAVGVG